MSLSLRDRVSVAVYPDRVVWVRAGRGLGIRVTAKGLLTCEAGAGAPWQEAVRLLPQALRDAGASGARVTVLLSNRLTRYAVTPNPDSAETLEERDQLARHAFERTHGEAVKGWEIRLSDAAPGRTALASAVDRELLAALRESVSVCGGQPAAIRPYLMAACNRVGNATARGSGVFALAEPERLCLLAWQEGGWVAVQQTHLADGWTSSLGEEVDRFAMHAGFAEPNSLRLCMPEFSTSTRIPGADLAVPSWPHGLTPAHDSAYAGAMLGLD